VSKEIKMKALLAAAVIATVFSLSMPTPPSVVVSSIGKLELEQIVNIKTDRKGNELSLKIKPGKGGLIQAGIFNEKGERLKLVDLSNTETVDIQGIPAGVYVLRVVDEASNMNMYRIEKKG
jgi:hypothetical protein